MRRVPVAVGWLLALPTFVVPGPAQDPPTAAPLTSAVGAAPAALDAAFAAAQPPDAEARWTLIPWRHSLRQALAEAERTGKAIYLFVNDGDVESGRC